MIVVATALCRRSTRFVRLTLSPPTERRRDSRFSTNLRGFEITSAKHSSEYEHDYEHEHEC
jgi:hypothetical protein